MSNLKNLFLDIDLLIFFELEKEWKYYNDCCDVLGILFSICCFFKYNEFYFFEEYK